MARIELKIKRRPDFANPTVVSIKEEYIKLDSFLKFSGAVLSGGVAKELIQGGKVRVNGEVCTMRGKKMRPGDYAELDGKIYKVGEPAQEDAE